MRKTNSSSITAQAILSNEAKRREKSLSKCILSNAVVAAITRSEEIKKKRMTQQAKKKRIILKRNEKINDEHDRYVAQQDDKKNETENRNESNDMKMMSRMNQSKEFQDFDDESKNEKMIEYSEDESITMFKKNTISKEKSTIKVKIVKEQIKKLVMLKKLKISNSIRVLRNKKRFDIRKMMNLVMSLSMRQLLNESQQLRKKFV
jgi:uncharacterized protein with von Willebrand factor type A (vWA) domain